MGCDWYWRKKTCNIVNCTSNVAHICWDMLIVMAQHWSCLYIIIIIGSFLRCPLGHQHHEGPPCSTVLGKVRELILVKCPVDRDRCWPCQGSECLEEHCEVVSSRTLQLKSWTMREGCCGDVRRTCLYQRIWWRAARHDAWQWRTQKIFMGVVHSAAYGGHLFLVCAVCDVTIWQHIHVSKPTFWRSLLT